MSILFVGLGRMGAPMARHLAGLEPLALFDVDLSVAAELASELDARALASLDAVPDDLTTVVVMVPSSDVVEAILLGDDGLLARLPASTLVIDMSSSRPESTRSLATVAAERGIELVDAPVSGGVAGAVAGTLSIMVGGTPAQVERARPVLERLGSTITHVGPVGSGDVAKALNNLLSATNIAAVAEVLSIAAHWGVDPQSMLEVINSATSRSQASEVKYPAQVLTRKFDSRFAFDLMLKDVRIAETLAGAKSLTTPVTSAAAAVAEATREQFPQPDLDHTELARYYEAANDFTIRQGGAHRE